MFELQEMGGFGRTWRFRDEAAFQTEVGRLVQVEGFTASPLFDGCLLLQKGPEEFVGGPQGAVTEAATLVGT